MEETHHLNDDTLVTHHHLQTNKSDLEHQLLASLRESPIHLGKLDDISEYLWRKDGVWLRDDDLMVINTEDSKDEVNAIVLGTTHLPFSTRQTTGELMSLYADNRALTYTSSRMLLSHILENPMRKLPYITDSDIWIPLDGAVKQNATWYNLMQLDALSHEKSELSTLSALLSFTHDIEVRIPYHYRSLQKKAREALKLYTTLCVHFNHMLSSRAPILPLIHFSGHYANHIQKRFGYEYYALSKLEWQHAFFLATEYEYQRTKNPHLSFQEWEEMWRTLI